LKLIEVELEI